MKCRGSSETCFPKVSRRSEPFSAVFGRSTSAAPVSSAAPKKKAFDRGGLVWPPRSNAADDRLGGGLGGLCLPSQKPGGLGTQWGAAPPSQKIRNKLRKKFEKFVKKKNSPLFFRFFNRKSCHWFQVCEFWCELHLSSIS